MCTPGFTGAYALITHLHSVNSPSFVLPSQPMLLVRMSRQRKGGIVTLCPDVQLKLQGGTGVGNAKLHSRDRPQAMTVEDSLHLFKSKYLWFRFSSQTDSGEIGTYVNICNR